MTRRTLLAGLAVVAAIAGGIAGWGGYAGYRYAGLVMPGVTVEDAPVGGLGPRELASRIEAVAAPALARQVTVGAGPTEQIMTAGDLGLRPATQRVMAAALSVGRTGPLARQLFERTLLLHRPLNLPVRYMVDPVLVQAALRRIAAVVTSEPKDAVVDVAGGRLVVVTPSQDSVVLDEPASLARVTAALERREAVVELAITLRRPAFTTEEADRMAEPVARFTTWFPFNPDRVHNIRLAASALRGRLLPPDGVFSYNDTVGPRDPARGYRKAPVLYGDILIPGDGGGVCQVSSTLFNAALLAEMAVEERTNHSQPVPYLPAGRDATVDYGVIDLRLRSTTGHHLFFWTEVTSRSLTVMVFGPRQPGREIVIAVTDQVWLPAPTHTVTRRDPFLPVGETKIDPAKPGLRVRTLRIVRQGGQVIRQEGVTSSFYRPVPRMIRIGAKVLDSAVPRAPAP